MVYFLGSEFDEYVARLGWRFDTSTGVIEVPQNPDNQIASTVVQEDIKLPRKIRSLFIDGLSLTQACRVDKGCFTRDLRSRHRSRSQPTTHTLPLVSTLYYITSATVL